MHEHTAERWLPVLDWEDRGYQVSDLGNVRGATGKIRKQANHGAGYRSVGLWDGKRVVTKLVHHLVLEAFVGRKPQGMEALHGDDDHANNRLENLRWGTKQENADDCVANGGTTKGRFKRLGADDVRWIREQCATGRGLKSIAEELGVTPWTVWMVKTGQSHQKVA